MEFLRSNALAAALAATMVCCSSEGRAEIRQNKIFPGVRQILPEELQGKDVMRPSNPVDASVARIPAPKALLPGAMSEKAIFVDNRGNANLVAQFWDGKADWQPVSFPPGGMSTVVCLSCTDVLYLAFHDGKVQKTYKLALKVTAAIEWSPSNGTWQLVGGEEVKLGT